MRRLVLMGAEKGPCVSARGITRPHLRVTGLPEGGQIRVHSNLGPVLDCAANGMHALAPTEGLEWIEVQCIAGSRKTICEIVSTKAA